MGQLFLNLHLLGAAATLLAVVLAIRQLMVGGRYKTHATGLAAIGGWQLITGAGMIATTPGISILRVCVSGFIYLAVLGTVEGLLIKRLKSANVK